jgi:hypothetical protein
MVLRGSLSISGRASRAGRDRPRSDGGIVTVRDEVQARAHFDERYGTAQAPITREIEQRVIGGDWGANGYTTMAQAETLASGLDLSAADDLLDIGTGRGRAWPIPGGAQRLPRRPHRPAARRAARGHRAGRGRGPDGPCGRGRLGCQRPPVPGRHLRCGRAHRRAVLTARQALRAESLQVAAATGRPDGLHHHLRISWPAARSPSAGAYRRPSSGGDAEQPSEPAALGRVRRGRRTRHHARIPCHRRRLAGRVRDPR